MMTVGSKIKQRREELDMTMEELARRLGKRNRTSIYQYEKAESLSYGTLCEIAQALNVNVMYFYEDESYDGFSNEKDIVELVRGYKRLTQDNREIILAQIGFMLDKQNKKDLPK